MRGCFGGCSFCSITEHEGRQIQSRSHESILTPEIGRDPAIRFRVLPALFPICGPTANMYKLRCKSPRAEETCRRASLKRVPEVSARIWTPTTPTIELYRKARDLKGIKKILIASGVRYDLAVQDPALCA